MAFTTIPGSGGAATTIAGSSQVDTITINSDLSSNAFIGAQQAADVVNLSSGIARSEFTIRGGQGADTVSFAGSSLQNSYLNGNNDADTFGSASDLAVLTDSTMQGGQGTDSLFISTTSGSLVNGNKQADTISVTGSASNSQIRGGANNDIMTLGNGVELISTLVNGDKGADTLTVSIQGDQTAKASGSTIQGGEGTDTVNGSTATAALLMAGGADNDNVTGGSSTDTLNGGTGADIIQGNGSVDQLNGGDGDDSFVYVAQGDLLNVNALVDIISGGGGVDSIAINNNGGATFTIANTVVFGGAAPRDNGIERITAFGATDQQISVSLSAASAATSLNAIDFSADTEAGTGGTANVSLAAAADAFTLTGSAGIDSLDGGAGNDSISGGGQTDTITGGVGADQLTGGAAADRYVQTDGATVVVSAATLTGAAIQTNDTITIAAGGVGVADVITDFQGAGVGDLLDLTNVAGGAVDLAGRGTGNAVGIAANSAAFITGNYDSASGVFTIDTTAAGLDTLVIRNVAALGGNTAVTAAVLGAVANTSVTVLDNFVGLVAGDLV